MAEFKINEGFSTEVSAVKTSVAKIDTGTAEFSDDYISTLETAVKYKKQQIRLKKLVKLYLNLLEKDTSDLEKMYETAKSMDSELADGLN